MEGRDGGQEGHWRCTQPKSMSTPELADQSLKDEPGLQSEVALWVFTPPYNSSNQLLQMWRQF